MRLGKLRTKGDDSVKRTPSDAYGYISCNLSYQMVIQRRP